MKRRFSVILLSLLVALSALASGQTSSGPRHVYLTWSRDDTSRSMTVNFQCARTADAGLVHYDTEKRAGKRSAYRLKAITSPARLSFAPHRTVHRVTLENLTPSTTYYFVAGDGVNGYSREYAFRTLPATGPIRFVTGGDMYRYPETVELMKQAARHDPMFVAVGGDIAYDNGKPENYSFWDDWLDNYTRHVRRDDGSLVPMLLAIGNHEVDGGWNQSPKAAGAYFAYFDQGGRAYYQRRLSDHTLLVVLDTGHVTPFGGEQAKWLSGVLGAAQGLRNRFALYHVALYPSHRGYDEGHPVAGRKHWVPIFDRFRLTAAFENHDHAFKRTKPLLGGKVNPAGTVYLGDGCFGQKPRAVSARRRWYEARARSVAHFWVVRADSSGATCQAVDTDGKIFDRWQTGEHRP